MGEKHLADGARRAGRARLLVAALPAAGALVRRHRERAPRRRHEAARQRDQGRGHARAAHHHGASPTASTRSSPAAGRSSTTRPAACPRPRSSTACSRRSSCSRRRSPARTLREDRRAGARRASVLLAGQRPGRRRRGQGDQGQRDAGAGDDGAAAQDDRALRQSGDALQPPCRGPSSSRTSTTTSISSASPNGRATARRGMSDVLDPILIAERRAAPRHHARPVGLGRGQRRHRQDQGADRPRDAPAARRRAARAHPLPHLHQGGGGGDAQSPRRPARPLGDGRRRDARQGDHGADRPRCRRPSSAAWRAGCSRACSMRRAASTSSPSTPSARRC